MLILFDLVSVEVLKRRQAACDFGTFPTFVNGNYDDGGGHFGFAVPCWCTLVIS